MRPPDFDIEPERYEFTEPQRYVFELRRRDFLRAAGAGLVVIVSMPAVSAAQESGQAGQASQRRRDEATRASRRGCTSTSAAA